VFDQEQDRWCRWTGSAWEALTGANAPVITHPHFTPVTPSLAALGTSVIESFRARQHFRIRSETHDLRQLSESVAAPHDPPESAWHQAWRASESEGFQNSIDGLLCTKQSSG
jgi:hypothetical protein